jgi:threonine/homoserine/homoserine lactone efflux protein
MTVTAYQLVLYAGALAVLFLTPGPVWAAIIARGLSGGFHAAWPLAAGVVVGDVMWPILAAFSVTWIASIYADFLVVLRYGGAVMLAIMGISQIRHARNRIEGDSRLTSPGMWAGFTAGILVIFGNPKAILFYMGILPGFFDMTAVNGWDIAAIAFLSMLVPLIGNVILAVFIDRARALISSPEARGRINMISGAALIVVGVVIAFT